MPTGETTASLIERWKQGDRDAAAELYRRLERRIRTFARGQIGPGLRAKVNSSDVAVSVFTRFFRSLL